MRLLSFSKKSGGARAPPGPNHPTPMVSSGRGESVGGNGGKASLMVHPGDRLTTVAQRSDLERARGL